MGFGGEDVGTETGRLSSRNPNLQQIPKVKDFRKAFIPAEGHKLIVLDYAGLEWRVLAHILVYRYDDWSLVDEIKAGIDPHTATGEKMGVDRHTAKILNYSINYGKSPTGLSLQLGIPMQKAKDTLAGFFRARPGIKRFHEDITEYARRSGFVRSLLGRYRYLDFNGNPRKAERQALNVIQPAATDIVVCAMLKQDRVNRHNNARLILQVHDELVVECPKENAEATLEATKKAMTNALVGVREFCCPLDVDGGIYDSWGG
jgi:DNA polymerase-1